MTQKTICLHQFIRPKRKNVGPKANGDCTICITDEENKRCKHYMPITINDFEVLDNENNN